MFQIFVRKTAPRNYFRTLPLPSHVRGGEFWTQIFMITLKREFHSFEGRMVNENGRAIAWKPSTNYTAMQPRLLPWSYSILMEVKGSFIPGRKQIAMIRRGRTIAQLNIWTYYAGCKYKWGQQDQNGISSWNSQGSLRLGE